MSNSFFKIRKGLNLPQNTANPADPVNGDVHFRSDLSSYLAYVSSAWDTVLTSAATQDISGKKWTDWLLVQSRTTPSNPAAGLYKLYPKADGKWYSLDSSGVETQVGGSAGGTVFVDTTFEVDDATDATKKIKFDANGTTGTTTTIASAPTVSRVLTLPDQTDTLATLTDAKAQAVKFSIVFG